MIYEGDTYLKTDQFGFNITHTTVLCTAVYIETINHYMYKGSDVYSCFIEASKAFDRVHWGKCLIKYLFA